MTLQHVTSSLVRALEHNDEARIQDAVLRLSRSRRWLAPLALAVGAVVLLLDGVRLLVSNWRLGLLQVLPAMWLWLAMLDLKAHVLYGRTLHVLRGPVLIPLGLLIVGLTVASFVLNAAFAFAIAQPAGPEIRPAFERARARWLSIVGPAVVVGAALALATMVATRWGRPWFTLALGITVGVMMVCYIAVPARVIGAGPSQSRRDKLAITAIVTALSVAVCAPPYLLGRLGILMLGSDVLLIPGIVAIAAGVALQAGATGAVRTIKLSASLAARGLRPSSTGSGARPPSSV